VDEKRKWRKDGKKSKNWEKKDLIKKNEIPPNAYILVHEVTRALT